MPRTLKYPPLESLESAGARVSVSAEALRLIWRIELSAPEYKPGSKPKVARVPASLKTEWRVWGTEPGNKEKDVTTWSSEIFSAMGLSQTTTPSQTSPSRSPLLLLYHWNQGSEILPTVLLCR